MLVDADSGGGSKGEGVPSPVRMFFLGGGVRGLGCNMVLS